MKAKIYINISLHVYINKFIKLIFKVIIKVKFKKYDKNELMFKINLNIIRSYFKLIINDRIN